MALVKDASPVRRLSGVEKRLALWLAVATALLVVGTMAVGPRPDLGARSSDVSFIVQGCALVLLFVSAAWSAFHLSVPHFERSLLVRRLPFAALILWIAVLSFLFLTGGYSPEME